MRFFQKTNGKQLNEKMIYIIAGILLVIILFMPIKLPNNIRLAGKIIPAREWILQRNNDGSMVTTFHDYRNGLIPNYSSKLAERGDELEFILVPHMNKSGFVSHGDTIGFVISNEIERKLAELKGEMGVARANLELAGASEKMSIIEQAKKEVALSREKARLQKNILEREQKLFDNRLISEEEFQITQSTARVYEIEAALADTRLKTVITGARPEQIHLIRSQISSMQEQIKVIEKRLMHYTLRSPIDGHLETLFSQDTVLMVGDTASLVVMPVNWTFRGKIIQGQKILIEIPELNQVFFGKIIKLGNRVQVLNGEQVFWVWADIPKYPSNNPRNLIAVTKIISDSLTPGQYVLKFLKSIVE